MRMGVTSQRSKSMPPANAEPEYFSFLASRYSGDERQNLRRDIKELGDEFGLPIWVAEIDGPDLPARPGVEQLDVVDACMAAISRARTLIAVVDGSLGTSLDPYGGTLVASYVEMELFQAAFLGKPVYVFGVGRIDDDSPTGRLLKILQFAYPDTTRTNVDGPGEVLSEVRRVLFAQARRKWLPRLQLPRRRALVGALGMNRHFDWTNEHLWQELKLLDGTLAVGPGGRSPDLESIDALLDNAESSVGSERKIARAWMAIRELMAAPYSETTDPRILALWDRALGRWAAWSAWYGMHAHLFLGHPAALGSLSVVRSRLEAAGSRRTEVNGHTASLNGAFASCYYSLSKMAPRSHRLSYLARAERYVNEGLARESSRASSGLHALLGSIALQRRDSRGAIQHYETALAISECSSDADDAKAGELRAELGWAQVHAGATKVGVANLRRGVSEMTKSHPPGFIVRGKKKLALGLATRLDFLGTFTEFMEARDIANEHQLEGQLDVTLRIGSRLGDLLENLGIPLTRRRDGVKSSE
jgi:hypothetical protein